MNFRSLLKIKYLWYGGVLLAFLFIGWKIVGLQQQQPRVEYFMEDEFVDYGDLRVVVPAGEFNLNTLNPFDVALLVNSFEPLVRVDENFQVKTGLAVSWGLLDDLTWEFTLRKGVKFHNGAAFSSGDVVSRIDGLLADADGEMFSLVDNIESIEAKGEYVVEIRTARPDPLLLKKLSKIFIVVEDDGKLMGTGPYNVVEIEDGRLLYGRSEGYWGARAKFDRVEVAVKEDKMERVLEVRDNGAEFISFVPPEAQELLREWNFVVDNIPSLEVQFLLFNFDGIFGDIDMRRFVSRVLDRGELRDSIGGNISAVNQFVSRGVFGFNNKISLEVEADGGEAGLSKQTVQVHLPVGLDVLGDFLRTNLKEHNILAVVSYLDNEQLLKSMNQGRADIYFLAFRSDFADSAAFFEAILLADSEFNFINYLSDTLNDLVAMASGEMNPYRRGELLRQAMNLVVNDDVVGVPLFEYEQLYAYSSRFSYVPRLDGMFYFDDLILK